jgi:hypothetical protein
VIVAGYDEWACAFISFLNTDDRHFYISANVSPEGIPQHLCMIVPQREEKMEKRQVKQICQKIVRFIVYSCEGEQYPALMEFFRAAKTRKEWLDAMHLFIDYGISQKREDLPITQQEWDDVWCFVHQAKIADVRDLHIAMIKVIARLELEKIHELEQYVTDILLDLEAEDGR